MMCVFFVVIVMPLALAIPRYRIIEAKQGDTFRFFDMRDIQASESAGTARIYHRWIVGKKIARSFLDHRNIFALEYRMIARKLVVGRQDRRQRRALQIGVAPVQKRTIKRKPAIRPRHFEHDLFDRENAKFPIPENREIEIRQRRPRAYNRKRSIMPRLAGYSPELREICSYHFS